MRITWDRVADAAYVYLTATELTPGRDTVDAGDSVLLDRKDGKLVGVEILSASAQLHPGLLGEAEILA